MNDQTYLILPTSELGKVDFNQISETSVDTVRKSIDLAKTLIKWVGDEPSFVSTLVNVSGPYTHTEILSILSTTEWTNPIPIP